MFRLILGILLLLSGRTLASHIVGGEIYYNYIGNDQYDVTLKIYRDCNGIGFDSPLSLYVYDGNQVLVDSLQLPYNGEVNVPAGLNYACYTPPGNVCVNESVYNVILTLPANTTGYNLVYQRCCRNAGILNLNVPGEVGSTYTTFIPPRMVYPVNSNPRYNNFPPIFICANVPISFDHSATDPDGDSLVYSLCDAYHGASYCCPSFYPGSVYTSGQPSSSTTSCAGVTCYSAAPPPPYSSVPYSSGYSGAYPMSANPALAINPVTGLLTGTPNQLGKWVVAICVSEYRNGQLLSINKRDFQFNVVPCITNVVAAIPTQTLFCNGFTVAFGNNSVNANTFAWNFGVPGITTDTSNLSNPVYTFPDSGLYTVTLIANPGLPCADTAYEQVRVYPLLQPYFVAPSPQCINGNSFDFAASGAYTNDATFFWNFGGNSVPGTSTNENPTGIVFTTPGTHNVVLTVSQYGCSVPYMQQIQVEAMPVPVFSADTNYCGGPSLQFQNTSQNTQSFSWDFGDPASGNNTSNFATPVHLFSDTGSFVVTLQVTNTLCTASDTIVVYLIPELQPDFTVPARQCMGSNIFNFQAGGSFHQPEALFNWSFTNGSPGSSSSQNPSGVTFLSPGLHEVTLMVMQRNCAEVIVKQVEVLEEPVAAIAPQPAYCGGANFQFTSLSTTNTGVSWNFGASGTSDTSSLASPQYTYADTGYFTVQLIADNQGLCFDTATTVVHVWPVLDPSFTAPARQCFDNNTFSFNAQGTFQQGAQLLWDFQAGNPAQASGVNPSNISFTTDGIHTVKLLVTQYGCSDSVIQQVTVLPEPVALIDTQVVFCNGFTINFGNSSQNSNSWNWDFGVQGINTDTSSAFEPTYTFPDSGTYIVRLIAVNEGLCYDTAYRNFLIYPLLAPEIINASDDQCITGNSFTFTLGGTYSPLTQFLWSFGNGADPDTSTLKNPPPVSYPAPGDYIVTLYGYENNCNKSVSDTIHIYSLPSINFRVEGAGCSPLTVQFTDESFSETALFYHWNFGDGSTSSERNPEYEYQSAGTYDVTLTIRTESGCIDTLTMTKPAAISVYQTPIAGFSIDSLTLLEADPTIIVTDLSQYASNCQIDFGDGFITDQCDPVYTYQDTGWYRITQIVTSPEGCIDSASTMVRIPPIFRFYIPNAFSPNGDGKNDVFLPLVIGAKELTFDVYDRWGERIFTGTIDQGWDGKYKGRLVQEDVYVYKISGIDVFGEPFRYKGRVTVVK